MTDSTHSNAYSAGPPPGPPAAGSERRGHRRAIAAVVVLALVAAGGAIWYAGHRPTDSAKSANPNATTDRGSRVDPSLRTSPVLAAPVRKGSLDIYLYALGTVTPLNAVVVRSRVDGQLMRVAFTEGQMVKAGELLARDRSAAVPGAADAGRRAAGARPGAARERASSTSSAIARCSPRIRSRKQQVDTQESLVRQYEGAVQADQGADRQREAAAHLRPRDRARSAAASACARWIPATSCAPSDANGLVVITQLQPITVVFPIPEDDAARA